MLERQVVLLPRYIQARLCHVLAVMLASHATHDMIPCATGDTYSQVPGLVNEAKLACSTLGREPQCSIQQDGAGS